MVEGRNSMFTPKPCLFLSKLKFLDFNPGRSYKKELKYAVALLVIFRKLAFSLISHPHHDLTHQRTTCDWTSVYAEVLKLLIFEAGLYQVLGPMHPTGPLQIEWGFVINGLSMHVWQWRPEGLSCPVRFYLHSSKDAKKLYSVW